MTATKTMLLLEISAERQKPTGPAAVRAGPQPAWTVCHANIINTGEASPGEGMRHSDDPTLQ